MNSAKKIIVCLLACLPLLSQCGLVSLFKFVKNDNSRSVTLTGDIHEFTDASANVVQEYESEQLNVMQKMLLKRDKQHNKNKMDVYIEAPYTTDSAQQRNPSCHHSLMDNAQDSTFTNTEFHDIEERKHSGLGRLLCGLPFNILKPTLGVVINGIKLIANQTTVDDIKKEYKEMAQTNRRNKKIFGSGGCISPANRALKSTCKQRVNYSQESYHAFKDLTQALDIDPTDTVFTLAHKAEQTHPDTVAIDYNYDLPNQATVRPALERMLAGMTDPHFELNTFARIQKSHNDQLALTGAAHTNWLKLLLEQTNEYSLVTQQRPLKLTQELRNIIKTDDLQKLLSPHSSQ